MCVFRKKRLRKTKKSLFLSFRGQTIHTLLTQTSAIVNHYLLLSCHGFILPPSIKRYCLSADLIVQTLTQEPKKNHDNLKRVGELVWVDILEWVLWTAAWRCVPPGKCCHRLILSCPFILTQVCDEAAPGLPQLLLSYYTTEVVSCHVGMISALSGRHSVRLRSSCWILPPAFTKH